MILLACSVVHVVSNEPRFKATDREIPGPLSLAKFVVAVPSSKAKSRDPNQDLT